jgi:ABC-type dipeptide/oligopeptide/nickel transport system ATPase component
MPPIEPTILKNRYPGVKPFTSSEKALFFGREQDIDSLYSLIFVKQTVVLYGKSGYGKSSLINAGIVPRLQEENAWIHFPIRFNNFSEREQSEQVSPAENIRLRLREDLGAELYSPLDALLPGEDSFWYWLKTYQYAKKKSKFILFFDQFEELFSYPKTQVEEFSEQLSQLLYNTIPVKFRKRLAEMDETDEIGDELHEFLYEKPEIKVLFSIRSDRLSLLNALTDRHPAILQNCYQLDALSRDQAREAILQPAKAPQSAGFRTPSFDFSPDGIGKILDGIADPQDSKIEAATLQIVCRYVEDELIAEKKYSLVTAALLGDITDIFKQYYEGILARLEPKQRLMAQHLIEDELIESGRRNPLTASYIKTKFKLEEGLLLLLEQSSLLRKERDAAGRILYEVSHDTLVSAIDKVAQTRRVIEEEDKRKELEKMIADERKRTSELIDLNKKAVFRSRLAIGLAIVSLLAAISARHYWDVSRKETRVAQDETLQLVKMVKVEAQNMIDDAQTVLDMANDTTADDRLINYREALNRFNEASDLLTQVGSQPKITDSGIVRLKAYVSRKIDSCQSHLPFPDKK